jgi:hypothetical protein
MIFVSKNVDFTGRISCVITVAGLLDPTMTEEERIKVFEVIVVLEGGRKFTENLGSCPCGFQYLACHGKMGLRLLRYNDTYFVPCEEHYKIYANNPEKFGVVAEFCDD